MPGKTSVSPQLASEVRWSEKMATSIATTDRYNRKVLDKCAQCGEPVQTIAEGGRVWYCCQAGHVSLEEAAGASDMNTVEGVWVAVRLMEDRKHLFINRAAESNEKQLFKLAVEYTRKAADLKQHIAQLKNLLMQMENPGKA